LLNGKHTNLIKLVETEKALVIGVRDTSFMENMATVIETYFLNVPLIEYVSFAIIAFFFLVAASS